MDGYDQVAEARRNAVAMATRLDLDDVVIARVALVVTEAATNLWKHAGGGEILLVPPALHSGIEILALDKGPGIADLARCFQDGYSTAGSPGTGLGAIRRLSLACDVFTESGPWYRPAGTVPVPAPERRPPG